MTVSKSKRDANKKWDAANMTVVGCRITKDKAKQFKEACLAAGTNPNAVLLACVNDFISDHSAIIARVARVAGAGPVQSGQGCTPGGIGEVVFGGVSLENKEK